MNWMRAAAVCLFVPALMGLASGPDVPDVAPAAEASCPAPPEFVAHGGDLPGLASAMAEKRGFGVLAIGSAAMLGPTGSLSDAFTHRAIEFFAASRPGTVVTLAARNARGALASEMLTTLRAELAAHPYPLVLWQAGAVEALRSVSVAGFRQTLAEGVRLIAQAHGSLILIDSQFSRLMQSKVDVAPYQVVMREIAGQPGVVLFRRYDLTRAWVDTGWIDLEQAPPAERQKAADRLNECLGRALAVLIGNEAGSVR